MSVRFALTPCLFGAPLCGAPVSAGAAEQAASRRSYDLPRGDAATMLRQFATVSGKPVLFMMNKVEGEQTNAIHGEHTPREALEVMLAGTHLEIVGEQATEGFVVGRKRPTESRAGVGQDANQQPQEKMKRTKFTSWLLALLVGSSGMQSSAQTTSESQSGPAKTEQKEEAVVLSPFVVTAEGAESYTARDTLAGNRVRTNLSDVGSSVQVATKMFMDNTNSKRAEDLLVLMTNTEVTGQGGNYLGMGDGASLASPPSFQATTRVRGLAEADTTRNFFLTRIPFDTYNVDRIDVQRGPNSILFGIGKPGGVVNATVNDAQFKNSGTVSAQVGSFGSVRLSGDLNGVVIPNELAVKVSVLDDETKYRQDPAFRDDKRIYGALRYEPEFLSRGSAHTTLMLRAEKGTITANAPMGTPPDDNITPYFTRPEFRNPDGSLKTYSPFDPRYLWTSETNPSAATAYESGGSQGISFYAFAYQWPDRSQSDVTNPMGSNERQFKQIRDYASYANLNPALPYQDVKPYKNYSLSDPSIFNFYDQLIYGPNAGEDADFDTFNADLAQTFFNGKVGLDLAYNRESSRFSNWNSGGTEINVDIMGLLPSMQPNPNVGRPYVVLRANGGFSEEVRETARLTGFAELDFRDVLGRESRWAKILGRHVFTGLLDRYTLNSDTRSYTGDYIANDDGNWFGTLDAEGIANKFVYLAPSINQLNSPSGLDLGRVTGVPTLGPTTLSLWNNAEDKLVTAPMTQVDNFVQSDDARRYSAANLVRNKIDSKAITWQAYLFDGALVPLVGYRTDKETASSYVAQPLPALHAGVDVSKPVYRLPSDSVTSEGTSRTYSLVAHLPRSLRDRMPGRLDISPFYNQSENFQPSAGRISPEGDALPDPKGKTKEYGVTISALDDKLTFRFTHFDTKVTDVNVPGTDYSAYTMMFPIAYGHEAYLAMTNPTRGSATSYNAFPTVVGVTSSGQNLYFVPDGASAPYTQAQIDAEYVTQQKALTAWGATVAPNITDGIKATWGLLADWNNPDKYTGRSWIYNPNVTVTNDTESKGTEWELSANPIKGLLLTANLSHTDASITNYAKSFTDFVNLLDKLTSGDAGLMRIWRGSKIDQGDVRDVFLRYKSGYTVLKAAEGRQSPEIRPWRFNGTVDYTFQTGRMKGVHVGGSYRWEDRNITGYPLATVDGASVYQVDNPYYGSTNDAIDLWVGYQRTFGRKLKWTTQLNVRNVFASDKLEVVSVQPDGSPAGLRIPEPRVITWTNTFQF